MKKHSPVPSGKDTLAQYGASCHNSPPQINKSVRRSPQQQEQKFFLQIKSVPVKERVNLKENRYILVIQPIGIRACSGQFTADEVYNLSQAIKGWDWSLDAANRPYCLPELESLIDEICLQSSVDGGAA